MKRETLLLIFFIHVLKIGLGTAATGAIADDIASAGLGDALTNLSGFADDETVCRLGGDRVTGNKPCGRLDDGFSARGIPVAGFRESLGGAVCFADRIPCGRPGGNGVFGYISGSRPGNDVISRTGACDDRYHDENPNLHGITLHPAGVIVNEA